MTKRPWTLGPWSVCRYGTGWVNVYAHLQHDDGGPVDEIGIADVQRYTAATTEANATLIAAAPDLYEALADLIHDYAEASGDPDEPTALKNARAALAKAGGAS